MASVSADPTIRRQVMAAARQALADDPHASIDRITRRAGVSRATFYRHFGSRAALLRSIEVEPRPDAATRILAAAQDILLQTSLSDLSMDELARAADVSRGTLYRLFPGKAALLRSLIERRSPFEAVRQILEQNSSQPPEIVLPLMARAVAGVAGERLGLMRAVLMEVSTGSDTALDAIRPAFVSTLQALTRYMAEQIAAGRMAPVHPIVAAQAFIGPLYFHLLTRAAMDRMVGMPLTPDEAVDALSAVTLGGLLAQPAGSEGKS